MLTVGSLFAGIGGIELGLERTGGFKTVWQVEKDEYARRVLAKHWPDVRRHDDVTTLPAGDADGWRCDVICGGFPCQDISNAGHREGISGKNSGLWREYARIAGQLRPKYIVVENVRALLNRGIGRVLGDLACIGYDAEWSVIPACAMGAPHTRERLFIVAYPAGRGWNGSQDTFSRIRSGIDGEAESEATEQAGRCTQSSGRAWWLHQPAVAPVDHGLSARLVDRPNRAIGRAVVPVVAEFIGNMILRMENTNA